MLKIFTIFFLISMVLLSFRIVLPDSVSDFFGYMEDLRIVDGIKLITKTLKNPNTTNRYYVDTENNIYNWFFYVLTLFFGLVILYVIGSFPTFRDIARFVEPGSPGLFIPLFMAAFFGIFTLVYYDGVKWFFLFSLPSLLGPSIVLLLTAVLTISVEIEVTGNKLLDTLLISAGTALISLFFTLGLKVDCLLGFPGFSLEIYLILLAASFLLFRIIFWVLKSD